MEALKALTLTIICTKVSKGLSFYYTVIFTGLSTIKAIVVPFTYTSSRPEMLLNIFQNEQDNSYVRVSFFIKLQTSGLELY